jgi:hypothetical protein
LLIVAIGQCFLEFPAQIAGYSALLLLVGARAGTAVTLLTECASLPQPERHSRHPIAANPKPLGDPILGQPRSLPNLFKVGRRQIWVKIAIH